MHNKENAGGFLCTDEERLLISRATELSERSENSAVALSFLTPREQRLVFSAMERAGNADRVFFWGGFFGAERRKAIFLPSWLELERCRFPLYSREREEHFAVGLREMGMDFILSDYTAAVKLSGSGYENLSHRDFLGALMGLGIKRSVLGDICVFDHGAVVICEDKTCDFILGELKNAGRDSIKCERIAVGEGFSPERKFKEIATTVASLRLDGVVRALCNISRDDAVGLVEQGSCEVNYFVEKEPDRQVCENDIITVRGYGKYIIDRGGDVTRRGRLRLIARKYV